MAQGVFGHAMTEALTHLRDAGNMAGYLDRMFSPAQYNAALGLAEIEQWEARFSGQVDSA